MRNLIIIIIILTCTFNMHAQEPDSIKMKTVFAELLGYTTSITGQGKVKVQVDFGGEKNFWGNDGRDNLIDETGKDIKFNSMVDAMNYMGALGWRFEAAYVVTVANQNVIHWLMSKEIPLGADARDGIMQRRDKKKKEKGAEKEYDPVYM